MSTPVTPAELYWALALPDPVMMLALSMQIGSTETVRSSANPASNFHTGRVVVTSSQLLFSGHILVGSSRIPFARVLRIGDKGCLAQQSSRRARKNKVAIVLSCVAV